jgi:hypothetical protein
MKTLIAPIIFVVCLAAGGINPPTIKHVVLPSSRLLRCQSASCSQLWQEDEGNKGTAIYPVKVTIDRFGDDGCPRGILALYDKSVSMDAVASAVNQRFAEWAFNTHASSNNIKLWRVEPEKFAIQLALWNEEETLSSKHKPAKDKGGVPQLIFEAFTGTKCNRE